MHKESVTIVRRGSAVQVRRASNGFGVYTTTYHPNRRRAKKATERLTRRITTALAAS